MNTYPGPAFVILFSICSRILFIKAPYLKYEVTQDAIVNINNSKVTITCENPDHYNYPADRFYLDLSWNTMKGYDEDVKGNKVDGVIFTAVTD